MAGEGAGETGAFEGETSDGGATEEETMQLLDEAFESVAYRERLGRYLRRYPGRNAQWQAYFKLCELMAARDFQPAGSRTGRTEACPSDDGAVGRRRSSIEERS